MERRRAPTVGLAAASSMGFVPFLLLLVEPFVVSSKFSHLVFWIVEINGKILDVCVHLESTMSSMGVNVSPYILKKSTVLYYQGRDRP